VGPPRNRFSAFTSRLELPEDIRPLARDGTACHRRVRMLYRPWGARYFGCRACHDLTYRSRQLHRDRWYEGFERPMKAGEQLRRAMGPRWAWRRRRRATQNMMQLLPVMTALRESVERGQHG
jgi:hypothetical protein